MKEKKFISLLSDTTFKYMFKDERFRPWYNELILRTTGIDIKDYKLIDQELNIGNKVKDYRLDLLLEKDNQLISIEMNQVSSEYTSLKNHTYLYRLAGNSYLKGEEYKEKYVTQINFNSGYCRENKDIGIICYELQSKDYDLKIEGIKDYEIYLGKYKDICYSKGKEQDAMLSLFSCESYDDMRKIANGNKEALEIVDELEKLGIKDEWGAYYDAEIVQKKLENSARALGYSEGVLHGEDKKQKEIALSMLKNNIDKNIISKCTGLSIEEIEKLS